MTRKTDSTQKIIAMLSPETQARKNVPNVGPDRRQRSRLK